MLLLCLSQVCEHCGACTFCQMNVLCPQEMQEGTWPRWKRRYGCRDPIFMFFVSQMMKGPEMQRAIVDNDSGWVYIGLMCFAIRVHKLAFAVEAVSAAQLGATTEMNALDLADEIISAVMPTLNDIPRYTGSVQQLIRESKDEFDNHSLTAMIQHLRSVLDTDAHQDNFMKRSKGVREIYSALCAYLCRFIEPARDEVNPESITREKLLEVYENSNSSGTDMGVDEDEKLKDFFNGDIFAALKQMLPEFMIVASTFGMLALIMFANERHHLSGQFIPFIRDLCGSLSLNYESGDPYDCAIASTSFQDLNDPDDPVTKHTGPGKSTPPHSCGIVRPRRRLDLRI